MKLKSQKGYSLLEIGVGLIIISIFLVYGITMLRGTYNTYRLVEQKNIALSYLIKGIEKELLDDAVINITDNPNNIEVIEDSLSRKVITKLPVNNMTLTTVLEVLPSKNGKSYADSEVKLLTGTIEYYIRNGDPSSKRELKLQTLKIGGKELGT